MTDYGRAVQFGAFVVPEADSMAGIRSQVAAAEQLGLDIVGIQDHPYQRRYVDTLALISALTEATERIEFFTDVVSLPLRPPAVLAKTAATISAMGGGRFHLGLGAGAFWDAIAAMGGPRRSPGEALGALSEAIDVIRLMWSDERSARYEGDHYSLAGVKPGPVPEHPIDIWLGVYGPRALRLLGTKADGWIPSLPSMPLDELAAKQEQIDTAAAAAGRDPSDIRRLANVNGLITSGTSDGWLRGPADQWIDELSELALEHGVDTFVLWSDGDMTTQLERFAEVAATVRAVLAAERQA